MNKIFKIKICVIISFLLLPSTMLYAQNGIVKSYYPDGMVQSETSYVNDFLDGAAITYYADGKVKTEKNYSQGILDGYVREYFADGLLKEEYYVRSGVKDGAYRKYLENGQLKELINYANGNLTSRLVFDNGLEDKIRIEPLAVQTGDENKTPVQKPLPEIKDEIVNAKQNDAVSQNITTAEKKEETIIPLKEPAEKKPEIPAPVKVIADQNNETISEMKEPEILCDAQVCPVPIGGFKSIQNNLVYPEHALRYGLEGTVSIIATINTNGDVIKTQVLKGLGLGCSEAAQEVIRKTKFIPGKSNGATIETNATIEIEFRIFNKKSVPVNN